jgi:uncharacterized membrane protein YuzA (DUF378 family)
MKKTIEIVLILIVVLGSVNFAANTPSPVIIKKINEPIVCMIFVDMVAQL